MIDKSGAYTLRAGLVWWAVGMLLAAGYFFLTYWMFRGKLSSHEEGYGH